MSEKIFVIPPERTRYLSEISENNRSYDQWVDQQVLVAEKLYSLQNSIDVLEKGCPLNFKDYLKNKNTCAQSYISKGTVLIDRLSDDKVFDKLLSFIFN